MQKRKQVVISGDAGGTALGRVIGVQKRTGLVHVKVWMGRTFLFRADQLAGV